MRCASCGDEVPEGVYCTRCGADQNATGQSPDAGRRRGRFAAQPDEHVAQPSVITTLFPHLDHDEVNEFRWALFAGLALLVMLYVAGLITAALLVAAFLVPILYLLYLYEVRVYRDAPLSVMGFTLGGGVVLGVVVSVTVAALRGPLPVVDASPLGTTIDLPLLLLTAVALPVLLEVLKPLPALLLRRRSEFGSTIDGLVFGVAAGLGFALGQTIIGFSQVLTSLDVRTDPANWIFPLITVAVLHPLMHGSSTGAITAAIWRYQREHRGTLELGAVVVALAAQLAFSLGGQLIIGLGSSPVLLLAWQAVVTGALLIYVRYLLHRALLDEAAGMGFTLTTCPNCHRQVTAAGFCPSCGLALSAVSSHARPRPDSAPAASPDPM